MEVEYSTFFRHSHFEKVEVWREVEWSGGGGIFLVHELLHFFRHLHFEKVEVWSGVEWSGVEWSGGIFRVHDAKLEP